MANKRTSTLLAIDPRYRQQFVNLAAELHSWDVHPFETFRTDADQMTAYNLGTSKARPARSAHGYGLACDFVPWRDGKWYWPKSDSSIWDAIKSCAAKHGLESPITWDRAHVQVPNWDAIKSQDYRDNLKRLYK